jgi:hypothetical protein
VRIWSISAVWVMNARIRIGPRHVGHASGSNSLNRAECLGQEESIERALTAAAFNWLR